MSKQGSSISFPEERASWQGSRHCLKRGEVMIASWSWRRKLWGESSAAWPLPEQNPNFRLSGDCHCHHLERLPAHIPLCSPICAASLFSGLEGGGFKYPFHSAVQSKPIGWVLHPCHIIGRSEGMEPRVYCALDGDLLVHYFCITKFTFLPAEKQLTV